MSINYYTLRNICVTNDHGYVPLVISTYRPLFMAYHRLCNYGCHQWSRNCLLFPSTWVYLFSFGHSVVWNNDLQKNIQKTKDRVTRTPLKPRWTHVLYLFFSKEATYIDCLLAVWNKIKYKSSLKLHTPHIWGSHTPCSCS